MNVDDLVALYGNQRKAALRLGYTRAAVTAWRQRGFIPQTTQAMIQIASRGRLRMAPPFGPESPVDAGGALAPALLEDEFALNAAVNKTLYTVRG